MLVYTVLRIESACYSLIVTFRWFTLPSRFQRAKGDEIPFLLQDFTVLVLRLGNYFQVTYYLKEAKASTDVQVDLRFIFR